MSRLEDEIAKILKGTDENAFIRPEDLMPQSEDMINRAGTLAKELAVYVKDLDKVPFMDLPALTFLMVLALEEDNMPKSLFRIFCIGRAYERKRLEEYAKGDNL